MLSSPGFREGPGRCDTGPVTARRHRAQLLSAGRERRSSAPSAGTGVSMSVSWSATIRRGVHVQGFRMIAKKGRGVDCAPLDTQLWAKPGPPALLMLSAISGGGTMLAWTPPTDPGGNSPTLAYDAVRSCSSSDFVDATCSGTPDTCTGNCATCLAPVNTSATTLDDFDVPPSNGSVFSYLLRAQNPCGEGSLGVDSAGAPRAGLACP